MKWAPLPIAALRGAVAAFVVAPFLWIANVMGRSL